MNKKTLIVVSVIIVAAVGLAAALLKFWPSSLKEIQAPMVKNFTDSHMGVSIDYPSNWALDLKDSDRRVVYFSSPDTTAAFSNGEEFNPNDILVSANYSADVLPGNEKKLSMKEFAESASFTGFEEIKNDDGSIFYKVNTSDGLWPIFMFTERNGMYYMIGISKYNPSDEVMNVVKNIRFVRSGE